MTTKKDAPKTTTPAFDAKSLAADAAGARAAIVAAGDAGASLVEAWVAAKNAAAVAAVAEDESAPGAARKAAKRGVQILKSRGVAIPSHAHVAKVASAEAVTTEAWISPPDAAGTYVVTIASRPPLGRYRAGSLVLRENVGVLRVQAGDLSASALEEGFANAERGTGVRPSKVAVEWARWCVAQARAAHATSGAIVPLGLDGLADLTGPAPTTAPTHPVDAAALAELDRAAALAGSADLHGEPEFASWLPDAAALQEMLVELGKRVPRDAAPDPQTMSDVLAAELTAATDRYFSPEIRAVVVRRLKDAAISVLARRGPERAALVMGVAKAVGDAGLITSPPSEIPFLRAFFQKALAYVASRNNGQIPLPVPAPPPEGAVVTPAQVAAEKARPGEKVSEGGIILPG